MKNVYIILLLILISSRVFAQNDNLVFSSNEIDNIALKYTGDTLNWPIIASLADNNIYTKTLTLTPSDLQQLRIISDLTAKIFEQKERIISLIKGGATIFAKDELITATLAINTYQDAVTTGNANDVVNFGSKIEAKVDDLELALMENRMVDVQARLDNMNGSVNKKIGLLGSWEVADTGDLFKEADGLKTDDESYANLGFKDGTEILIDPNTTAVIRKSRLDQLNESNETEITLEEGGLLARLSKVAAERNNFILNAGNSKSKLNSTNFYAESDDKGSFLLTNYDGIANVSANDVTITIRKNEGTVIKDGQAPSKPIQLLPPPKLVWTSKDTLLYTEQVIFPFHIVNNAHSYIVQRSSSRSFTKDLQELRVNINKTLLSEIPIGDTYVRVQSVDKFGLRGAYSEIIHISREIDNNPPPAFIDNLNGNIVFTKKNSVTISGATQPNARLLINNKSIKVDASGKFTYELKDLKSDQRLSILATEKSGNNTFRGIRVVYLKEESLFKFKINGKLVENTIQIDNSPLTFSSKAYPGLEVIIKNGDVTKRVQTDTYGRWDVTMTLKKGKLSITFKDSSQDDIYVSKSYNVVKR